MPSQNRANCCLPKPHEPRLTYCPIPALSSLPLLLLGRLGAGPQSRSSLEYSDKPTVQRRPGHSLDRFVALAGVPPSPCEILLRFASRSCSGLGGRVGTPQRFRCSVWLGGPLRRALPAGAEKLHARSGPVRQVDRKVCDRNDLPTTRLRWWHPAGQSAGVRCLPAPMS